MYKVMIVDDESVIKKGLVSFINWESLDCAVICEASNGFEATEHLSSHPIDIIVTDIKMPGMDGIGLAKYVYENYPHIKVIFSTSYSDFSYAQAAIKYNVVDFVVKTNPTEKIPTAISKAKDLILQQKKMKEAISENFYEIREKIIGDILNRIIINPEIINIKLQEAQIFLEHYFIVAFEISEISEENSSNVFEEHNQFMFLLKTFFSSAFIDYHHFTLLMNKNLLIVLVSYPIDNLSDCLPSLMSICKEIIEMVVSFIKFTISIGISKMHTSELELSLAYHEAHSALLDNFYFDNNVSFFTQKIKKQADNRSIDIQAYSNDIVSHLQQGDPEKAESILRDLFDEFKRNKESIEQMKVFSMLLCSLCFRLLANYKLVLVNDPENETMIYKQIQDSKSIQSLSNIMYNTIHWTSELISTSHKKYNHLVNEATKYIKENYNKDINLQSIANNVHVNSSYLSRLYKKETGESIIDTLNKYRIEIAKLLLKDPSRKTFEVGAEVGIDNPTYFSHVFTKYAGVSPKEFKAKANLLL